MTQVCFVLVAFQKWLSFFQSHPIDQYISLLYGVDFSQLDNLTIQLTCNEVAFSIELLEWGHPLPGYWRSENSDTVGRDLKMG